MQRSVKGFTQGVMKFCMKDLDDGLVMVLMRGCLNCQHCWCIFLSNIFLSLFSSPPFLCDFGLLYRK